MICIKTYVINNSYNCELIKTEQVDGTLYVTNVFIHDTEHSFSELVKYYRDKDARYNLFGTFLDMYAEHFPEQIQIRLLKDYSRDGFEAEIQHFGPIDF